MRIRHIWEGAAGPVPIRVEQWRAFPFRARTSVLVRGQVVASTDTGAFATMLVRISGESGDADGRRDVVATIRGEELYNAQNLCTVTYDGRNVVMHVVQTRWLSAQSGWFKLLLFLVYLVVDYYVEELVGNQWVEFVPLVVFVCGILIADAVPMYPSRRSTTASA